MFNKLLKPYKDMVLARYEVFVSQQKQDEAKRARESAPVTIPIYESSHESMSIITHPTPTTLLRDADKRIARYPFGRRIVQNSAPQ
ncbi:MAG: hypothetical protein WCD70_07715 [Alphaproteobacteria bacterium]